MSSGRNDLIKIKSLIKEKVQSHIEKLNEGYVMPESDFKKVCQMLSKDQYYNITDERSLYEICGYPLCEKSVPKPTESKQLFLLTKFHALKSCERSRFCSDNCYFSSNFLMNQLEDEPAWNLLGKPPKSIKLFNSLTVTERTCFKLATAIGFNEKYSKEELEEIIERGKPRSTKEIERKPGESLKLKDCGTEELCEFFECVEISKESPEEGKPLKDEEVVEMQSENELKEVEDLPRFEKIMGFVKEWSCRMEYYHCAKHSTQFEQEAENRLEILSIVDCSNVLVLRRGIVKERMKQAFNSLPNGLNKLLVRTNIFKQFAELVSYLEFSNTNILLDNIEWKIIALILLKVFSLRDDFIKQIASSSDYESAVAKAQMTMKEIDEIANVLLHKYLIYVLREENCT